MLLLLYYYYTFIYYIKYLLFGDTMMTHFYITSSSNFCTKMKDSAISVVVLYSSRRRRKEEKRKKSGAGVDDRCRDFNCRRRANLPIPTSLATETTRHKQSIPRDIESERKFTYEIMLAQHHHGKGQMSHESFRQPTNAM